METLITVEAIDSYLSSLSENGYGENTVKAYRSDLLIFWEAAFRQLTEESRNQTSPKQLPASASQLRLLPSEYERLATRWIGLSRGQVSPKTLGRRLVSVRGLAKYLSLSPLLSNYRLPHSLPPEPHPLPGGLADVRKMLAVCETVERAALVALCGLCGLRVEEARSIKPSAFDLQAMTLKVYGKGDKWRKVPVSDEAFNWLAQAYMQARFHGDAETDDLLVGLGDRTARKAITTIGRAAGIARPVASHDLRMTFATEVYEHTKDIIAVQQLLGHADVTTTQGYVGTKMSTMQAAVAAVSPGRV